MFRVVTQDRDLSEQVDDLFVDFESTAKPARAAHLLQITGDPGREYRLHIGCHRLITSQQADSVLAMLVASINRAAIARADEFAVHAAVVARDGRVLVFPADSGGGKTTLAAAAVLSGFLYLSDEALILRDDGKATPYPKPMALSEWSCERLGLEPGGDERLFTAADLGGKARKGASEPTDLVISHYGADEPLVERITSSEAVSQLLGKSFNHYKDPERAFLLSTEFARCVNVWRLRYDDPKEAIELLERSLGV